MKYDFVLFIIIETVTVRYYYHPNKTKYRFFFSSLFYFHDIFIFIWLFYLIYFCKLMFSTLCNIQNIGKQSLLIEIFC